MSERVVLTGGHPHSPRLFGIPFNSLEKSYVRKGGSKKVLFGILCFILKHLYSNINVLYQNIYIRIQTKFYIKTFISEYKQNRSRYSITNTTKLYYKSNRSDANFVLY